MIFAVMASFGFLLAQDAAGTYKLTGTKVQISNIEIYNVQNLDEESSNNDPVLDPSKCVII